MSQAATDPKVGRPRRYDLEAPPGFANADVGLAAAALDELRERVIDQIADLPQEALTFVPEKSTLSIAVLVVHMVWAEMNWVRRITGCEAPQELVTQVDYGGRAVPAGERVVPQESAAALVALCRRVRDEVTHPALADLKTIDEVLAGDPYPTTPKGVLMHLIWHWTYHSGQIGLLRELWGSGYTWTFGSLG
ncbi:MAG: DinB family protein [Anaerolineae bacterium]